MKTDITRYTNMEIQSKEVEFRGRKFIAHSNGDIERCEFIDCRGGFYKRRIMKQSLDSSGFSHGKKAHLGYFNCEQSAAITWDSWAYVNGYKQKALNF